MRDIKFRAWDKVYEHFHEGDIIREYSLGDFIDNPEYVVSQYTGFKDRNGKLIFEGDILKWDEKEWGSPFNELVEWDYDLLSDRARDWAKHCEIIGNKWENPELINSKEMRK